jgi:hypothetical protein
VDVLGPDHLGLFIGDEDGTGRDDDAGMSAFIGWFSVIPLIVDFTRRQSGMGSLMMAIPFTVEILRADGIDELITHTGSSAQIRIVPGGLNGTQAGHLALPSQCLILFS